MEPQPTAEKPAERAALPAAHAGGDIAPPVFAPGPGLCLQRAQHLFGAAERVVIGVVPGRVEHHRRGKSLGPGQPPPAPREGFLVDREPPAGVPGRAEHPRLVAGEDRFEAEPGAHRVDRGGAGEQRPGVYGGVDQGHAWRGVLGAEMSRAVAGGGLGVGLDDERHAGVLLGGDGQHLVEPRPSGAHQRGIARGLVDDQHEGRGRQGGVRVRGGVERVILRQMRRDHVLGGMARAGEQRGVVERVGGEQGFEIGGTGGVEMRRRGVDQEPHGRGARAAGLDRPQEGVFEIDLARAAGLGQPMGARRGAGRAPDADGVLGAGPAEDVQLPARQRQDAPEPLVAPEGEGGNEKPPGRIGPGGASFGGVGGHQSLMSPARLASVPTALAAPAVVVIAVMSFDHCT